jgi:NADPH2:quinone reductase
VIVAVHAAPVNFVDALVVTGAYQSLPRLPFTPGKGPAGVVCAIAPDVERLHIGDHVLAMAEHGGYAEKVAVAADQCYSLPRGLSFVQAAAMGVAFDTAWCALRDRARLQPGETVLVLGASGAVGIAAVQLAKAMGARVLAAIARKEKSGMAGGRRCGGRSVRRQFARQPACPGLRSHRCAWRRHRAGPTRR